ncbi:MAG: penicillin-binding protein activator LpoB [Planctomycetota bacterium]|nr:penicillin-binding protein activator LpoB [Planctomycetota bacterium]
MNYFRYCSLATIFAGLTFVGCASHRYGHILAKDDKDMVGSHAAGAATWNPLVDEAMAKLLSQCPPASDPTTLQPANYQQNFQSEPVIGSALATGQPAMGQLAMGPANVCFIGVENKSAEEVGDFKDQLYERIDSQINADGPFRSISRRMVTAALRETRLRPDSLYLPQNRDIFSAALGRQGTPIDYLLYANITSGTTERNKTSQRDYLLTLELVNVHTGETLKESAKIRKGYSKSRAGKWWNFGWFDQADG